ncbi:MAG TPA: hypothetical protein VIY08_09605 [Candidatus Nitrosocosmicus sp.]
MGIHCLIIYKDLEVLRKFYSQYTKIQIEENNESVLINSFYETSDFVRQILYKDMLMDISKHEKEESLLIIDSMEAYFGLEPDNKFKERMANHAKEIGKEGLSILNDTGAYHFKGMLKELVEYELSLPTIFDLPLKRICMSHQKDFDRFSNEQRQKLVDHHGMTIKMA